MYLLKFNVALIQDDLKALKSGPKNEKGWCYTLSQNVPYYLNGPFLQSLLLLHRLFFFTTLPFSSWGWYSSTSLTFFNYLFANILLHKNANKSCKYRKTTTNALVILIWILSLVSLLQILILTLRAPLGPFYFSTSDCSLNSIGLFFSLF